MALKKTGVEALDHFLQGGLPESFTTLVLAPTGSGVEIFAKQFATGVPGEPTVYITTDESQEDVEEAMTAGGWSFDQVEIIDLQSAFAEQMLAAQGTPIGQGGGGFDPRRILESATSRDVPGEGPEEPMRPPPRPDVRADRTDYLARLIGPYTRPRPPKRMVVHSLDFFLNLYPFEQVVAALTALKAANARQRGHLLLVLAKGAHGTTTERRLELLADCLIELEVTRKGTTFERFFMVKKVKNRATGIGVSTYETTAQGFHLETLERIV